MSKAFASKSDMAAKTITFEQLSEHGWAYTAEGDPNSGVIVGDDGVMVVDSTATPVMAQDLIARIRKITDKPIKYVTLEAREIAQGFVLTCQSHPLTPRVVVSYDER